MMKTEVNRGAELGEALVEIKRLQECEAVKISRKMGIVSAMVDTQLRALRRQEREGIQLKEAGITLEALDDVLRMMGDGDAQ